MTKSLTTGFLLLISWGLVGDLFALSQRTKHKDLRGSSEQTPRTEYEVGSRLAACVIEGCTIFIGTVREFGLRVRDDSPGNDRDATYHTKITLHIDEWIRNGQSDLGPLIQLEQTQTPERRRLGSWRNQRVGWN